MSLDFKSLFYEGCQMREILPDLLIDRTTEKNIVWATDAYESYGAYYKKDRQMLPDFTLNLILNETLVPRTQKSIEQQKSRTKKRAEVFTPSWICNTMNNICDEQWFGQKDVFNTENSDNTWTTINNKIEFKKNKNKKYHEWQRYVDSRRIEITCGEAPFLVQRYDTTTGNPLKTGERIGILDRKLRVINENASTKDEWIKWTYRAFKATYGFELQGDNLFIARVNLVQTFIDYYNDHFNEKPEIATLKTIAKIVSWNVWQMDGLTCSTPFAVPDDEFKQLSFFNEEKANNKPVCKIRDWRKNTIIEFTKAKEMN